MRHVWPTKPSIAATAHCGRPRGRGTRPRATGVAGNGPAGRAVRRRGFQGRDAAPSVRDGCATGTLPSGGHRPCAARTSAATAGKFPAIVDGDFVLWESNAILRYPVMQYGGSSPLYPPDPAVRASIDRWLDWSLSTLQPAERPLFWGIVRTPAAERDMMKVTVDVGKVAPLWKTLDK